MRGLEVGYSDCFHAASCIEVFKSPPCFAVEFLPVVELVRGSGPMNKVKVEIAGGLPVGLLDWETVNFTWLQSGQTFEFNIGTDKEIGYFEDFSVYYDDMTLRICMLTVYPVDAYTEKPILTYEPSWSGTR